MTTFTNASMPTGGAHDSWFRWIGAGGSVLAMVILGASMMLRLWTEVDANGHATSTLPPITETVARMAHRVSATAVAMLALCAGVLYWVRRRTIPHLAIPVICIVTFTTVLALIGPLTQGYRLPWVTVLNVTAGMALLIVFWWLLARPSAVVPTIPALGRLAWLALIAFVIHVASGAATSAWEMTGIRWPAFLHLASLFVVVSLIGLVVMERRSKRATGRSIRWLLILLAVEMAMGYALMQLDLRPRWLSLLHGMLSPALALTLVSILLCPPTCRERRVA